MLTRVALTLMALSVQGLASASNGYTPKVSQPSEPAVSKTCAEVLAELAEWRRNPVTADGYRWIGGDRWKYVGVPNQPQRTRAEVIRELREWERNPVTSDGYRLIRGERWEYVGVPNQPQRTRAEVIRELRE